MELSATGLAALQYATYVLELLGVALATIELVWPAQAGAFATYVRDEITILRRPISGHVGYGKVVFWILMAIAVGAGVRYVRMDDELRGILIAVILTLPLAQIVAVRFTPGREIAGYGLTIACCGLVGEGLSMFVFS